MCNKLFTLDACASSGVRQRIRLVANDSDWSGVTRYVMRSFAKSLHV